MRQEPWVVVLSLSFTVPFWGKMEQSNSSSNGVHPYLKNSVNMLPYLTKGTLQVSLGQGS